MAAIAHRITSLVIVFALSGTPAVAACLSLCLHSQMAAAGAAGGAHAGHAAHAAHGARADHTGHGSHAAHTAPPARADYARHAHHTVAEAAVAPSAVADHAVADSPAASPHAHHAATASTQPGASRADAPPSAPSDGYLVGRCDSCCGPVAVATGPGVKRTDGRALAMVPAVPMAPFRLSITSCATVSPSPQVPPPSPVRAPLALRI